MKYIFALSCILAFLGCKDGDRNKPQEGVPESYSYNYAGMMIQPILNYEVERAKDGTITIAYCANSLEATVYKAPADLLEKIGEMVSKYKVYKLKRSYQPSMEILDGYGWHMFIAYENGYIGSGGSNAWPSEKDWQGVAAINKYIQDIIDAATEADIIEVRPFRR